MFFIIFNLEFSSENHYFNKNDNNVDLVNPATGLLMKDGVDPLGNVFGKKQHNENNFK
ncbi:hypothetical protein ACP179_03365 [Xenorhabdus stockiae]|uniref:hypothetical protein n=1 Tax=Xenorhabdus stockiae TaxID=351614 RepID=UPI003CF644A0